MPPIKHMSVADRIAQKRYRKQPKVKRKLKIRAKKMQKLLPKICHGLLKREGMLEKIQN
ncbi:hypothetical protein F336_004 [Campylobacter phage F336]|uniref:Uncharacterized protein n=1 Tax=Campylobacter phage F336 TaxID=2794361 RepID=A0A7T3KCY4_9CAUD|nr:hypothetical protein F336_004 [Campylobacter phage F336]